VTGITNSSLGTFLSLPLQSIPRENFAVGRRIAADFLGQPDRSEGYDFRRQRDTQTFGNGCKPL
jgi:hypothetical protein